MARQTNGATSAVRAGELDRRGTLQSPTTSDDGEGGQAVTWTDEGDVWLALDPLSQTEALRAGALMGSASHRARLRYRDDVVATWRLVIGTRTFDITGVREIGRQGGTELDLVEVVA